MFELRCVSVCMCVTEVWFEFIGYTTARLWKTVGRVWTISQCRRAHMEKLLSVWKISTTYWPGGDSENPFLASPWELSQRIINMTVSTHRKFVLVLACSAVFHMVFPIDGTLMVVTQLWSMSSYQYFSLCLSASVSLFPLWLISQSIRWS